MSKDASAVILVAAIGILVGGCSSASDPDPSPDPAPAPTGTVQQAAQPSCADKNARCAKLLAGSTALDCPGPTRTLAQRCVSSDTPATDESWLCCVNAD